MAEIKENELLQITTLANTDHVRVLKNGNSARITWPQFLALLPSVPTVINTVSSTSTNAALSANQGRLLNLAIQNINTLLASDDTNLDDLQEIVNFIKINKSDLDNLAIENIAGLQTALDAKVDKTSIVDVLTSTANNQPLSANMGRALKVLIDAIVQVPLVNNLTSTSTTSALTAAQGKILKDQLDAAVLASGGTPIVDNLTSTSPTDGLSANQGRVLKQYIDDINTLLTSNDSTLDDLQEIVDFITANKDTLDTLSISNIAGLQTALDAKLNVSDLVNDLVTDNPNKPLTARQGKILKDLIDALPSGSGGPSLAAINFGGRMAFNGNQWRGQRGYENTQGLNISTIWKARSYSGGNFDSSTDLLNFTMAANFGNTLGRKAKAVGIVVWFDNDLAATQNVAFAITQLRLNGSAVPTVHAVQHIQQTLDGGGVISVMSGTFATPLQFEVGDNFAFAGACEVTQASTVYCNFNGALLVEYN